MQFLYADGTDAHFMDTESYEQIGGPRGRRSPTRCAGPSPTTRSTCCSSTSSPSRPAAARARSSSRSPQTEPGLRGDTASGGGNKPATLETGAIDPGAAVRRTSATASRSRHAHRRVHVARVSRVRRSDQRRAAVFALYQHDLTGRELDDVFERDASTVHARARLRRAGLRARTSTTLHRPPRQGLDGRPHRPAGAGDHARRAARDAAPRRASRPTRRSRPRARSTRPSRPPRRSAAPTRRGSSTASWPRSCARHGRMPGAMSGSTRRPRRPRRPPRARGRAAALRRAVAPTPPPALVEDCAALAARPAPSSSAWPARRPRAAARPGRAAVSGHAEPATDAAEQRRAAAVRPRRARTDRRRAAARCRGERPVTVTHTGRTPTRCATRSRAT